MPMVGWGAVPPLPINSRGMSGKIKKALDEKVRAKKASGEVWFFRVLIAK